MRKRVIKLILHNVQGEREQLKGSTGKHTSVSEGKEALADYMGWKALNHPMRPSKNLGESRKDERDVSGLELG